MEFFIAILPPHRNFQQPFLFDSLPLLFVTGCSARSANKSQGRVPRGWLNKRNFLGSLSLHSSSFVIVLILNFFIFFSCRVAPAISPPAGNNRLNISVSTNINKNPVRTPLSLSLFPPRENWTGNICNSVPFFLFSRFRVFFYQEEEEEGSEPRWNISVRVEEIFGKLWLFDSAITGRRGMEFGLLIREIFGKRVGNGVRTVFKENKFFGTRAAEYLWWMRRVKGYGVPFDDAILEHPCESAITTPKKFLSTLFNVDIIVPSIPYKILFLRHCCLV